MTMRPIEDQARELMLGWAQQRAPSAEACERTWAAVQARASAGDLGPDLDPEPSSLGSAIGSSGAGARLLLVGLGLAAVVGGLGLKLLPRDTAPTNTRSAAPIEPVEHGVAPAPGEPDEDQERHPAASHDLPPAPLPSPAAASSEPLPRPRSGPARRIQDKVEPEPEPGPAADEIDPLTIEMQLLGAARTALKSGDTEAALARLDEHADRFPKGALRSERELSRITALCEAGRLDAAEAAARRFIAKHPGSTQAKRLRDTCIGDRL
ncbi:MAG: outer membrane protein assembly factor BamD [Enhygromyxa sp.]